MSRILFATSEAYPLIKTGGLADVSGSLPVALQNLGHDVRLVLPAYGALKDKVPLFESVAEIFLPQGFVRILEGNLPGTELKVWLVESESCFDRMGNPYLGPDGYPWHDNADRFALFSRVIVELAQDHAGLDWRPDVVHCNDWQTGLVPALLSLELDHPVTIFTIHNLAYQGNFPYSTFVALGLPESLWSSDRLEFYGQVSFIKGGLAMADRVTTVSPSYANEIQTPEFGYGMEGLLDYRQEDLVGILNGIDGEAWDPGTDPYLDAHYSVGHLAGKARNKKQLQKSFDLEQKADVLLIGMVGRLVSQKGVDMVLESLGEIMELPVQLILLGSGEHLIEQGFQQALENYPGRLGVHIGYNEGLAHLVEAGSDLFLMPSRFEPCGLNQMYSLRYGTLPLVRRVGGLADTVVDASLENIREKTANGFVFDHDLNSEMVNALKRAVAFYGRKKVWRQLQVTAMEADYSWEKSARLYEDLYQSVR